MTIIRAPKPAWRALFAALLGLALTVCAVPAATADPSGGANRIAGSGGGTGVTVLCADSGFGCTRGGYDGTAAQIGGNGWATWQYWSAGSAYGTNQRHNCTTYAAYRLQQNGYPFPGWTANARDWDTRAWNGNPRVLVDQTPAVGAIAQWNRDWGHVAYVEVVTADYVEVTSDNFNGGTNHLRVARTSPHWPDNFIHFKDVAPAASNPLARYAGHIVQWDGDTKVQRTAWLVTPDLKRLWIPDIATYNCLKAQGAPGPDVLPAATLDQLTDQTDLWAACGDTLSPNRVLRQNMSLTSADGRYRLWMQGDGNLVLYGPSGRALWANYRFTSSLVVMQGDGNLVTYGSSGASWASNTAGTGANRLVVQNDGNLVLYAGSRPVWSSNTAGRT